MVARFPVQISKLPPRLPTAGRRSTSDLTFQPADALSAFDSALLPRAEARGAHSVALSPLESALTNASHLLDSTCFEAACFYTLAQTSPASPVESALTKIPGVGSPTLSRLQRPASSIRPPEPYAPRGASIPFGLTRSRILPVTTGDSQRQIFRPSNVPALAAFAFNRLQPLFTKTPGVWGTLLSPSARHSPQGQVRTADER